MLLSLFLIGYYDFLCKYTKYFFFFLKLVVCLSLKMYIYIWLKSLLNDITLFQEQCRFLWREDSEFLPYSLDVRHSFQPSTAVSTWLNIIINVNKIFYWLYEKVFYFALFLCRCRLLTYIIFLFSEKNPFNTPDKSDVLTENDHSAFAFRFAEWISQIQRSKLNLAPRSCFTQIFEYFM